MSSCRNPTSSFPFGNLLADLVKGRDRAAMSARFLNGVRQHQAIDVFTDSHPIVHRSRARLGDGYPHVTACQARTDQADYPPVAHGTG